MPGSMCSSCYWRRFRYWENDSYWLCTEWCKGLYRCTKRETTQRSAVIGLYSFSIFSELIASLLHRPSLTSTKLQVVPRPTTSSLTLGYVALYLIAVLVIAFNHMFYSQEQAVMLSLLNSVNMKTRSTSS